MYDVLCRSFPSPSTPRVLKGVGVPPLMMHGNGPLGNENVPAQEFGCTTWKKSMPRMRKLP